MCLAKAYYNLGDDEPVFKDIAHIQVGENQVAMKTLFGEEKVLPGRVIEIDFSTSKIILEP